MGKVIGFEISSQDPKKAIDFYSKVFDWKIADPEWDYWAVDTLAGDSGINGGISKGPADYPHGTRIQIEVDSIEESLKKAVENGALIVRDKMEFDHYYLAYLIDPTGIGIGLVEKKK